MTFSTPLKVSVTEKEDGVFVISPVGSIDTDTYEFLEERVNSVLEASPKVIIFDMEGVSYISSRGVSVVIKAEMALKKHKGMLTMVNLQPQIKKVFDVLKVIPPQQIFTSIDELDSYLDMIQQRYKEEEGSV